MLPQVRDELAERRKGKHVPIVCAGDARRINAVTERDLSAFGDVRAERLDRRSSRRSRCDGERRRAGNDPE